MPPEDPDIDEFEIWQARPDVVATNKASFVEVCTDDRHKAQLRGVYNYILNVPVLTLRDTAMCVIHVHTHAY